jgi:ribose/xylose/arabinose/galactoside ABC-type transport system permease subunit
LVVILFALSAIGALASPSFINLSNINNIMINIAIFGLLAIGQSLVMITKEIDLSVGSMVAFAPITAVVIAESAYGIVGRNVILGGNYVVMGLVPIAILTLCVGVVVGIINGLLRVKASIPSLIVTLGTMYTLGGLSYVLSGGYSLYLTKLEGISWLGVSRVSGFSVSFVLFVIFGAIIILLLKYTVLGNRFYSVGGNEKAAIYSGITPGFWKIAAFGFSGFCAGLSALIYSSRLESIETSQGSGYELIAIAIAVIGGVTLEGGRGSIFNTLIASAILAVTLNIMSLLGFGSWYQNIVIGSVIIGAALQHGLIYRRSKLAY